MMSRSKVLVEAHAELKAAEGGAWSTPELIQMGLTPAELARSRRRFGLVYWRDRFGGYHYPKWQFDPSMKVLSEVATIVKTFRTRDTMRVLSWFVQPVAAGRKSLLHLIRTGQGRRAVALVRKEEQRNAAEPPLSKADAAELLRRQKDFEDRTRYVVVSCWSRKHVAVYDVESGSYIVGAAPQTCLIRKRECAEKIARLLDGRRPMRHRMFQHQVAAVRKTPRGIRLLDSLPDPAGGNKRHKPRLRAARDSEQPPILATIAPVGTRAHILDAFVFVFNHREAIARLLADAESRADAQERLQVGCNLSAPQADAALELRLWQITKSVAKRHEAELQEELRVQPAVAGRPSD